MFLMGAGYDRFHSYTVPLASLCGAMVLTLILLTRLGPYRYGVEAKPTQPIQPIEVPSGAWKLCLERGGKGEGGEGLVVCWRGGLRERCSRGWGVGLVVYWGS